MAQLDPPTSSSTSFAQRGNFANFTSALHSDSRQPWIIDSGAADHIIGLSTIFSTYHPCSKKDKVKTANGTLSSVSGKGVIHASNLLQLSSVLHVPNFSTNLLSISRITQDLNCCATFFPTYYVFSGPQHEDDN